MMMKYNQYFYSEKSNDASTSHVQIEVDKVTASIENKVSHLSGAPRHFGSDRCI